jgi:hypothetical protein
MFASKGVLGVNINNDFGRLVILMMFSMKSFHVKSQVMGRYLLPENGNAFIVEDNDDKEYCFASYLAGLKDGLVQIEACPPPFSIIEERNWFYTDAGQIVSVVSDYGFDHNRGFLCLENKASSKNWDWAKFSPCSLIGEGNLSQQVVFAGAADINNTILSSANNTSDYRMHYNNIAHLAGMIMSI